MQVRSRLVHLLNQWRGCGRTKPETQPLLPALGSARHRRQRLWGWGVRKPWRVCTPAIPQRTCLRGKAAISPTRWHDPSALLQVLWHLPLYTCTWGGGRLLVGGFLTGSPDPKYTKNIWTNRFCK